MAFTSGLISGFTNKVIDTREKIGDGNGATTIFSYQVSKNPVFLDSLTIEYIVGAATYQATSDSNGDITGTHLNPSTINAAGTIDLDFSTAPDAATEIETVSYTRKGLLQTVLDFITTNKATEILGTGNGATTAFSNTLTTLAGDAAKGQLRVKFKVSSFVYTAYDDGDGEFQHPKIASSSINYSTKAVSITFTEAIDSAFDIEILYTTGAEGRDWLVLLEQNTKDNVGADAFPGLLLKEVVLRNSGVSFKEDIFVGIREFQNVDTSLYGHNLNCYKIYGDFEESESNWNINSSETSLTSYSATTENFTQHPMTPFLDESIQYFIYSNKRRLIVQARVGGTKYTGSYLGQGIRIAKPSEYTQPTFAIGNAVGNIPATTTSTSINYFINPAANQLMGIMPDSTFEFADDIKVQPLRDYLDTGVLKHTTLDEIILWPIELIEFDPSPEKVLVRLDGVFHCPSDQVQAEQTIAKGADTYRIFQDIYRNDYNDFMCVLEE